MTKLLVVLLSTLSVVACVNFHVVDEGKVYRSAQPDIDNLRAWIKEYNLKTVLRLRGGGPEDEDYQESYQPTVEANIAFVHIPMSSSRFPKKKELEKLCHALETAEYPMLIHCKAGADRTGLASAIYVILQGQEIDVAHDQLALIPYGHTGLFGTGALDEVLEMYRPWQGALSFCEWVDEVYERPVDDELPDDYYETQAQAVKEYIAKKVAGSLK